jgi:probable F420-dependent oxidoreductase
MARKFRFGIQTSKGASGEDWIAKAKKIEELGYSTLFMPDHFDDQFAPMPAMAVAAAVTTTLRVGSLVFDNDYKHPVVLAKEAATLDVLSGGRLELGIGAGWMATDYEQSGIPYESPSVRIGRLREAVKIFKGLFSDAPLEFSGKHYTIRHNGTPKPVQKPHPPILIGGGGERVLRFAAREADIVGVNFDLREGAVNPKTMTTGSADATKEKIGWIRDAAGPGFEQIELNVTVFVSIVTDDRDGMVQRMAPGFNTTPQDLLDVPHALIGSVDQIVDELQKRRDEYGFSYVVFSGDAHERMAPVVKRLAGT